MRKKVSALAALFLAAAVMLPASVFAATNPTLSQVINQGAQTMDIVDGSGVSVASPSVAFAALPFSFACQTNTATFGTASQKVSIKNERKAQVSLTMAGSGTWTSGSDTYNYNDGAGSGCTTGQLSVSGGSFTKTAGANTPTNSLPGGAFSGATPVTLFATSGTKYAWDGELTGYTLTQKVPAEQPDGTYSVGMTLTATFN